MGHYYTRKSATSDSGQTRRKMFIPTPDGWEEEEEDEHYTQPTIAQQQLQYNDIPRRRSAGSTRSISSSACHPAHRAAFWSSTRSS